MSKVETVEIQTDNGKVTINKSDFDSKIHKLAGEEKQAKKKSKATK